MQLRDYQEQSVLDINETWQAVKNVLLVAPTGSGKTVIMGRIIADHNGPCVAIAHRKELVSQISLSLARYGVFHKIIGPQELIREIVQLHIEEAGQKFYDPSALCAVASVDTLNARSDTMTQWLNSVTLWITDEAHHIQAANKWGRACDLFPNAKGLGFTATPCRADGGGLGSHVDGLFDTMIQSSTMRELIDRDYLTEYRIFAPPSDLDMSGVKITGTGEFSAKQTKSRFEKSHILGDVVKHYLRIAPCKLGITFAIDVETANKLAAQYNDAGVPAKVVTAKTSIRERSRILKQFKNREIMQLVNVDLFGEGFDLPAIEVVSMARPTMSYSLYVQQFGRVLRLLAGKNYGIIIDHVGNVDRHGLPDRVQRWTLDRREKARKNKHDPDLIPLKTCVECSGKYEAVFKACPYCGSLNLPSQRSSPNHVDGDLKELDPDTLAAMRGDIDAVDGSAKIPYGASEMVVRSIQKRQLDNQKSQFHLRDAVRWVIGYYQSTDHDTSQAHKLFYFRFNIDVMSAQALKKKDADILTVKINNYLINEGVTT